MADFTGQTIKWKQLWQLTSGNYFQTSKQTVLQKLRESSKELIDGIQIAGSTTDDCPLKIKEKCPEKLFPFLKKLQQFLNIDFKRAWDLLCMFISEYQGSAASLSNYLATEANMVKLLNDIWDYFAMERMSLLKIMKNVLEFSSSIRHPYASEYRNFLTEVKVVKLRTSYINQLKYLINDQPPSKLASGEFFSSHQKLVAWSERKTREMIEILQILILLIDSDDGNGVTPVEFQKLFLLFKSHSFGRQTQFLENGNKHHAELVLRLAYCEVAVFLKCCNVYRRNDSMVFIAESVKLLEQDVVTCHQNPEHGPVLLAWMLFNFGGIQDIEDDDNSTKFIQFGSVATRLGVFEYLNAMMRHPMFQNNSITSRLIRQTLVDHLSRLCDLFDGDGSVAQHSHIYELMCELLKTLTIAKEFCSMEEHGLRSLFNTSLENFPIDFLSLSSMAHSLALGGTQSKEFIQNQLLTLPMYSEYFNADVVQLRPSPDNEDEFILINPYTPFKRIMYTIPAGTTAVILDKPNYTIIHFRYPVNYFNVLQNEINQLLDDARKYAEIDDNRKIRVTSGLKYLTVIIQNVKYPYEITEEMVPPTEMVFDLFTKFKMIQNPPIELLASCLDICSALLRLFKDEIIRRICNLNILPIVANDSLDFRSYVHGCSFDSGLVGLYLINFERNLGKYDFLLAYLNFVKRTFAELEYNPTTSLDLPSLIFLLREVFPHVHTWHFINESDRIEIYTIIMQCFSEILQLNGEQIKDDPCKATLRHACVYSLLNIDNGMTILRFIAVGNDFLQKVMQDESNWMTASNSGYNLIIRLSMTLLMQILRLRNEVMEDETLLSPLESIIYTQPKQRDTLRIIPVVTSYMNNIFNRSLPVLSCRLLQRFAIEFQMSLLACLDMEADQIRLTFLSRLRDELERDDLKIAVIEFVEACINKQPGLTEAFFKLDYQNENRLLTKMHKHKDIGDGILTYMAEFLAVIENDPSAVASKLLSRIMYLFHALWKNNMQSLVQKLTDVPTFWPSLMSPLYAEIGANIPAYSQLFNIIGIQLFRYSNTRKIDKDFNSALSRFFEPDLFKRWVDSVLNIPEEMIDEQTMINETPDWLGRLQSFKDLLVIVMRRPNHKIVLSPDNHKYLAENCLLTLVDRAKYTDDLRPFIILSELYWFLILGFESNATQTTAEEDRIFEKITELLNILSCTYQDIHYRARESILAIAFKSIELLSDRLLDDERTTTTFINAAIEILCFEINTAVSMALDKNTAPFADSPELPFILSVNIVKTLLTILSADDHTNWHYCLISKQVFHRILSCGDAIFQYFSARKASQELLRLLVTIASGPLTEELIHCDIGNYLWLKLLPPKDLVQNMLVVGPTKVQDCKWQTNDWWPIYTSSIELVTILLQNHGRLFLKEALLFVGVHEEFLMDSILLAKHTIEQDALMLVKASLELIAQLTVFQKEWRLDHSQSMMNLMRCVQIMLDHSVAKLTDHLNEFIEIVVLCIKCLLAFSPKLINLIVDSEFLVAKWQPLVEIQFGAPKLNVDGVVPQLTFGTFLTAAARVFDLKSYSFDDPQPMSASILEKDAEPPSYTHDTSRLQVTPRRLSRGTTPLNVTSGRNTYMKSLSVSSCESVSEILTNPDKKLCITALEYTLTLLASQSLLAIKDTNLSNREKQLIKRELSTELHTFHNFIKRRILNDLKGPLYRKHYGIELFQIDDLDHLERSNGMSGDRIDSLRVLVTRRQHLETQMRTPIIKRSTMDISRDISPLCESTPKRVDINLPSSTPLSDQTATPKMHRSNLPKKVTFDDDDLIYYDAEEPTFSGLSIVKMSDRDYLHFLSNLFDFICQNV